MWLTYDYWLLSNIISLFPSILPSAHHILLQTHQVLPMRVTPLPWAPSAWFQAGREGVWAQRGPVSPSVAEFCWWAPVPKAAKLSVVPRWAMPPPFPDWCTWPLNWGKLLALLFLLLCNEIVNSPMQGKCFCSAQSNTECRGSLSMTWCACICSNTNSK